MEKKEIEKPIEALKEWIKGGKKVQIPSYNDQLIKIIAHVAVNHDYENAKYLRDSLLVIFSNLKKGNEESVAAFEDHISRLRAFYLILFESIKCMDSKRVKIAVQEIENGSIVLNKINELLKSKGTTCINDLIFQLSGVGLTRQESLSIIPQLYQINCIYYVTADSTSPVSLTEKGLMFFE